MRFTILGCGTSTGVPLPGCDCDVCRSGDPKNIRMRTSGFIETDSGQVILIDASTDLRHQALQHGLRRVDAVIFTHAHADHILGVDDLRVFNFISNQPIACYGTRQTLQSIRQTFPYIFDTSSSYEGGLLAQLELHEIAPYLPFSVCGVEIVPFQLWHGKMEVLGFRIGKMSYATDCNRVPSRSGEVISGSETLILDGLRFEPHNTHFSIPQAIEQAGQLDVDQTYLIHMSHNVDYHKVNAALPERIALAYDGLSLPI